MSITCGMTPYSKLPSVTRKPRDGGRFPAKQRLATAYRELLQAAGWEFGASVLDVMRCPECPKDAKPDPDKAALKAGIVEILGDDEDGLAATFEDYGL
jgi:hypothetical protein